MNRFTLLNFFVLLLIPFSVMSGQKIIPESLFPVFTYASDKVNRVYIPPPAEYFKKAGNNKSAVIEITYSGFPASAVTASEYAASILEALLPEGTYITVSATWEEIEESGVLANSSSTGFLPGNVINAWKPDAIYAAALAEKIAGRKLNDDAEGDILLRVNNTVNWYLGTDGKTPTLRYDLVTVILHELIHGLGFFDSFNTGAATGSYGIASLPMVYDIFVENNSGQKLTDTNLFNNPSASLKAQLTSGLLYFNGPVLKSFLLGGRSRLYAPATFESGSSIAHLDEETYKPAAPGSDALMTPFIARGEAIHDPGKVAMAMLGDIGWINTRIIHVPEGDTEENIPYVVIDATIQSDTSYNHNKVILTWSFDSFKTSRSAFMSSPASDDHYTYSVTIPSYETRLDYFITAEDYFLRSYLMPSDTSNPYSVYVGTDTVKPVIIHQPAEYYLSVIDYVSFIAEVSDNIGTDTVYAEYKLNEGSLHFAGLEHAGEGLYKGGFSAKTLPIQGGDSLLYRIIAVDKAAVPNQRILPSEGWFSVAFERINSVSSSYETDFENARADFLVKGFEVTSPEGFSGSGLHTKHPYESPEESGDSIGYVALLRTPVRYDGSGIVISYNEVVLVEPGEEGSLFGSDWFYDYVIVEGSRDYGKTWFSLVDGYDSRYLDAWETAYNSSITNNNSTYTGKESMQVKRVIFPGPRQDISAGDTMIVRFRLFSDPYANGWGWCIDDLYIGPLINSVNDFTISRSSAYPNPGNGKFTIRQSEVPVGRITKYTICNSTGTTLFTGTINGSGETDIDISGSPPGLYLVLLYHSEGVQTLKYIKR